jgi:hypothetical protein
MARPAIRLPQPPRKRSAQAPLGEDTLGSGLPARGILRLSSFPGPKGVSFCQDEIARPRHLKPPAPRPPKCRTRLHLGGTWPVRLRYTLGGAAELAEVLAYIEERSPQGARHVQARYSGHHQSLVAVSPCRPAYKQGPLALRGGFSLSLSDFLCRDRGRGRYPRSPSQRPPSINHAMTVANPVHPQALRIDKKAWRPKCWLSDQRPQRKRPAYAYCFELAPKAQPPRKRSGQGTARG